MDKAAVKSVRLRRVAVGVLLFGLGFLLGPVLLAIASGLTTSSDEQERLAQTYRLLRAHDEQYPQFAMLTLDISGAVIDCGYDPEDLFGPTFMAPSEEWTTFEGYFDLFLWRSSEYRERVEGLRADYLRQQLSPFATTFLEQCLRRTVFASLCSSYVRDTLESDGRSSLRSLPAGSAPVDQSRQNRTICTYLDGVAAGNGRPLSQRRDLPPAPTASDRQ